MERTTTTKRLFKIERLEERIAPAKLCGMSGSSKGSQHGGGSKHGGGSNHGGGSKHGGGSNHGGGSKHGGSSHGGCDCGTPKDQPHC